MLSAYKYRLYPSGEQEMRLKRSLLALCDLYNELRARKIEEYKVSRKIPTKTDIRTIALQIRRRREELKQIHSQVVQNVADRVHIVFNNYFEKRASFPRAKKCKSYRSLTYPQSGLKLQGEVAQKGKRTQIKGKHYLSKIGGVRIFIHRAIEGKVKRLTIKYEAGEWYGCLLTEREEPKKQEIENIPEERIQGADLGLERFVALSSSESEEYPEFLRQSEEKFKLLQKRLSSKGKGSKRYKQLAFQLAKLHLHVARQREDWQKKLVFELFKRAEVLVLEKLSIQNMLENHNLAKSIADAFWDRSAMKCIYKADMLGKYTLFVDACGTTQFCYNCLQWVPKDLRDREHICPNCGVKLSRDENSARLIKRLGILNLSCPRTEGRHSLSLDLSLPSVGW